MSPREGAPVPRESSSASRSGRLSFPLAFAGSSREHRPFRTEAVNLPTVRVPPLRRVARFALRSWCEAIDCSIRQKLSQIDT